jgi:hypothetical protein
MLFWNGLDFFFSTALASRDRERDLGLFFLDHVSV